MPAGPGCESDAADAAERDDQNTKERSSTML